ncbi:MAG TPA: aconitase X catalytic domain-containing protein [Casimicrobiaceae bacterium]|nr:aconitase X catalytic domain-containing protein [Casimicrobiaceae bacterium]
MKLTMHQQAMLDGAHGLAQQLGMRMLTAVGRAFDAEALLPVESVHLSLSGVSVGAPGLRLFEQLASQRARFVVPTTLNVLSADRAAVGRDARLHASEQVQMRILEACQRMGALATCSCNPFLLGITPAYGDTVAWNESATAPYVNGVLGAHTNREGATALASALTGYTAAYGMHLAANRRARVVVEVDARVSGSDAFAVLGGAVGRACGERIPLIDGIPTRPSLDEFTAFCASLAAVSPLAMFHMTGITPEARTRADALPGGPCPTITVRSEELAAESARHTTATGERVDVVAVGCPHASLAQVREVAALIGSSRVHAGTTFLLQTNAAVAALARHEGLLDTLQGAGVELTSDTCVHIAYREPPPGSTLVTNALKIAYLTPSHGVAVRFATLEQCVRAATAGRWQG